MSRPTQMIIDLDALQHNLQRVREIAPHSRVMAMVKANAYGHGIVAVAQALNQADALGVASLEEAVKLRDAGISQEIVLIEGLFFTDEVKEALQQQVTLIIHHLSQVEMLERYSTNVPSEKKFKIWLKINTGMNRLGIDPADLPMFYARLQALFCIHHPVGLMTHFAEADDLGSPAALSQITLFQQLTENYPGERSLCNSAGILAWKEAHADWVRPGLMLYGASPFADKTGLDHGLKPVMTLASRLIAVNHVKQGQKIGYGGTWIAPTDVKVGIVGVGYGDGYPQSALNLTPVLINNHLSHLTGRVSMDMLAVLLKDEAKINDPVILWGQGLPVEFVAKHSHSSAYEVLTRMTPRPKIEIKSYNDLK